MKLGGRNHYCPLIALPIRFLEKRKNRLLAIPTVSAIGRRPVIRPLDDGIMAIPLPPEDRDEAHKEMREFIRRNKEKEKLSK
ncbi:hypothetical protein L1N85_16310 [Paenibacillus alkaliterrae]|uniref:hypothetical protein n=1 Tax=Paenibacillus alkaliterrae TaxID=320909 RepID=UPI001F262C84|nr:hypothetical protein [Paenibacillus alkaliterrae]MCF2939982.1 hypothetical protein [Paenibacillus alkaliterrae]